MISVSRADQLEALVRGVDVLVIGGGITGAGVALDAASRGYRVGLVERADFASGTSSRSTKLVHGGIRYLPQGHVALVRDALRERGLLMRLAPHLVHPLAFAVPLYAGARRPLGVRIPAIARPFVPLGIRAGLFAYDLFARNAALRHRAMSRDELVRDVPGLSTEHLRAALVYYDGRTDDVRLTHAVLATARAHGAVTLNHAAVTALRHTSGRVAGAVVEDVLTGRSADVAARFVVNATGIWGEAVAAMDGAPPFRIRHSKGAHLVLRPDAVSTRMAIVIPETDDGRLAFIVPWAGRFVLGTTDDAYDGDLTAPAATTEDVTYLLDHANRYLRRPLSHGDITGTYAGIRALVAAAGGSTSSLSRDHVVATSPGGLISIVGGKLTTYRKMAADTVDAIVARDGGGRSCRTASIPLAGASGLDDARAALESAPLSPDQRAHLLETYGGLASDLATLMREDASLAARLVPGMPVTAAEVVYACRAEEAATLTDCLFLRTRLAVLEADAGDRAVEPVAALMTKTLGWDPAEISRQRDAYERRRAQEWGRTSRGAGLTR
jgi:glycerol-3-phosphate dehydrogenase